MPEGNRLESDREKDLGNECYKAKNFGQALEHYQKGLVLDPSNVLIMSNQAAVYFEQGNYDACIETSEKAIEVGREQHLDYKVIAKSLARIAHAYVKKGDYANGIKYYQKSLTEHRNPEILAKLKEVEKEKERLDEEAYHSPSIAEQERALGNEAFKKGDFVTALKHYTECIKRNKTDPRGYSNRAACYAKLLAFPEAIRDCDACLGIDPTFVKAYLRKAAIFYTSKEYQKVIDACLQAREHDPENKHKQEIDQQLAQAYLASSQETSQLSPEETLKRAMADPEVQAIMVDPIMQQILSQMQSDPKAIFEHMKNPAIANKIRKLMTAGIIRTA